MVPIGHLNILIKIVTVSYVIFPLLWKKWQYALKDIYFPSVYFILIFIFLNIFSKFSNLLFYGFPSVKKNFENGIGKIDFLLNKNCERIFLSSVWILDYFSFLIFFWWLKKKLCKFKWKECHEKLTFCFENNLIPI